MGQPFLGEIKIMSFGFAPQPGWAMCNGQLMPINQNQALFSLLGTVYGGNGQTTFALPDLRGQVPIHQGKNVIGTKGGEPSHTLSISEMPTHQHVLNATSAAASNAPENAEATHGDDTPTRLRVCRARLPSGAGSPAGNPSAG